MNKLTMIVTMVRSQARKDTYMPGYSYEWKFDDEQGNNLGYMGLDIYDDGGRPDVGGGGFGNDDRDVSELFQKVTDLIVGWHERKYYPRDTKVTVELSKPHEQPTNLDDLMSRFLALNPKDLVSAELDGFSAYLVVDVPKEILEASTKLSADDAVVWEEMLGDYTAMLESYEYSTPQKIKEKYGIK